MATVANSIISVKDLRFNPLQGSSEQSLLFRNPRSLCVIPVRPGKLRTVNSKNRLVVQAQYRDGGRSNNGGFFIGGFIIGGFMAGALACVYAPQISKALTGTDKKDLMKKLPKFIYDEEKALEKTRKVLADKIAQLNDAIDGVSSQLRADEATTEEVVDEINAAV